MQELRATAWAAPTVSAKAASNSRTFAPVVSHLEVITSVTAAISACRDVWDVEGKRSDRVIVKLLQAGRRSRAG